MVNQPQVEFQKHRGSNKFIIQIVDPRKRIFVLDGGLVDGPVILDQTVCFVALLDKERRCSPRRGTWANEPFCEVLSQSASSVQGGCEAASYKALGNRN